MERAKKHELSSRYQRQSAHVRRQSLPVWPPTLNKIPLPLPLQAKIELDQLCV